MRVFEKKPLIRLQWDPWEFWLKDPFDRAEKRYGFFQLHSIKTGRHILAAQRRTTLRASQFWTHQGVTSKFLAKFWRTLWEREQDMRINVFQWPIIHRALLVRQWLQQSTGPTTCLCCSCQMETLKHCLWECHVAQQVWR